jgi:hypothetical protein
VSEVFLPGLRSGGAFAVFVGRGYFGGFEREGGAEGVFLLEFECLRGDEARCRPPGRRLTNIIFVRNMIVLPERFLMS